MIWENPQVVLMARKWAALHLGWRWCYSMYRQAGTSCTSPSMGSRALSVKKVLLQILDHCLETKMNYQI